VTETRNIINHESLVRASRLHEEQCSEEELGKCDLMCRHGSSEL